MKTWLFYFLRTSKAFPFDDYEIDLTTNTETGSSRPCPNPNDKTSKFEIRGFSSGDKFEVTVTVRLRYNSTAMDTFTQVLVVSDSVPVLSLR